MGKLFIKSPIKGLSQILTLSQKEKKKMRFEDHYLKCMFNSASF